MKKVIFICLCLFSLVGHADNLKIQGTPKVISVTDDLAEVEVQLSWDNSWRNIYNYDAVYLFAKYQEKITSEWYHLFWDDDAEGHVAANNYTVEPVNGGRGIFIYRQQESLGKSAVTLRLKWKLKGNSVKPLTRQMIESGQVFLSVQGIEMVYVPTAPFYAGGGSADGSFSSSAFGILPAKYDIIGTNSNFVYSGNGSETAATYVNRPADRVDAAVYNPSNRRDWSGTVMPAWWQVNFKSPRTIRYFGVSGVCWQNNNPAPASNWYLLGTNNSALTQWDTLWRGGPEYWGQSMISYPIQRAIRVTTPGSYQYYRVLVKDSQRKDSWNNINIANVAMAQTDLGAEGYPVLMDGLDGLLPVNYPDGLGGFYVMKYELSQEQYVMFLNQLNRSGQYVRTIGGLLDGIPEGGYIFGPDHRISSHRNGIVVQKRNLNNDMPYVFACNLNSSNQSNSLDDGQAVACNYLSPGDMLAYADWSGLRPLSELEYEKMCRGAEGNIPTGNEYAWGSEPPVFITGIASAGKENEASAGNGANVNAGGKMDGPVRAGIFIRGNSRVTAGNSFWGIADLSGNLSEIYCNAELYGRQLDGRGSGTGVLTGFGGQTTGRALWPIEPQAYGLKGGDYSSPESGLKVADRQRISGYYKELSERHPTVGIRLGHSVPCEQKNSVLTLQNGLVSGAVTVYDTVCNPSDYLVRGDSPDATGQACHYIWYMSGDEGESWQKISNSDMRDLYLNDSLQRSKGITIRKNLYKRIAYTPNSVAVSGVVGIVLASGYTVSRLSDTLQPCMASPGYEIKTPIPAVFEWYYLDNNKKLTAVSGTDTSSFYTASIADIKQGDRLGSGVYQLGVYITMKKGCSWYQELELFVRPWTTKPWEGNEVMNITDSDADFRQLETSWGGRDRQKWTITSTLPGALTIDSLTGVLHGMAQTMCNLSIELVCADYPDQVYTKAVKETYRDWYFLEPGAPRTLTLLPGKYKMECMGSQGGSHSAGGVGGLGGHVWGYIELDQVQQFHIYVGRTPYNPTTGGYNGGGGSSEATLSSAGGGATDIRLTGGAWDNLTSLQSRVMVAGGGGSGAHTGKGGHGGGLIGGNASGYMPANRGGAGGTQTEAGYSYSTPAGLGRGGVGNQHGGGGGGGYYGGGGGAACSGAPYCSCGGGGGSGYVSGFPGCTRHPSGLRFENTGMTPGVHLGKGYVRIEQL